MSEPTPITRFDFARGELRGTELSLYPACLVHRGAGYVETVVLANVGSVRVEFLRDRRRLGWGGTWLAIAVILLAASPILATLATAATQELATQNAGAAGGVGGALVAFFRFLERFAEVLPFLAVVAALAGAALCALGWLGSTTLTVTFGGGERSFPVRGRDALLLAFSERVSEQIVAVASAGK